MIIAIIVGVIDVLFFWSAARIASKADDRMRKQEDEEWNISSTH